MLGTWNLVSECISGSVTGTSPTGCMTTESATVDTISGTITFNADGTYVSSVSTTSTLTTMLGPACLTADGDAAPLACDTLNHGTCRPSGGGCSCTSTFMSAAVMGSGTYTTAGTTFTTVAQGAMRPSSGGYCVRGTELDVTNAGASMSTGVMGGLSADIVLRR